MAIKLFTQNDTPYGKSMQEWSNRWWNWMVGQPKSTNPTEDSDGTYANNCQTYQNVFFLSGTTTNKGSVTRKCNVPDGKSVLLPVICYEHSILEDGNINNANQLLTLATQDLSAYGRDNVSAKINGDQYKIDNGIIRIKSPLFSLTLPKDNVWDSGNEGPTIAAADGYWIFINDLDPGSYDISVRAQPSKSSSDSLEIDTSYKMNVG
jgi:hypothetical protein